MNDTATQLEERIKQLETRLSDVEREMPADQVSIVVFSGDMDRLLGSFIMATGAAAMYDRVVMFFTFWGTAALRDAEKKIEKADIMAKMFGMMLPKGSDALKLSKMNMFGMGTKMMKRLMEKKGVMGLKDLIKHAADFGVEIIICEMSMDLMGLTMNEFIDYPNITVAGVAKFLQEAGQSKVTLFV